MQRQHRVRIHGDGEVLARGGSVRRVHGLRDDLRQIGRTGRIVNWPDPKRARSSRSPVIVARRSALRVMVFR
jgi:hypothetical protein